MESEDFGALFGDLSKPCPPSILFFFSTLLAFLLIKKGEYRGNKEKREIGKGKKKKRRSEHKERGIKRKITKENEKKIVSKHFKMPTGHRGCKIHHTRQKKKCAVAIAFARGHGLKK